MEISCCWLMCGNSCAESSHSITGVPVQANQYLEIQVLRVILTKAQVSLDAVTWQIVTNVSEKHSASISSVKQIVPTKRSTYFFAFATW
jgi:hypothetical protein